MTDDEAVAEIKRQADLLWGHIPAELTPPDHNGSFARFDTDGRLLVIHGQRWFNLVDDWKARTWVLTPGQPAVEIVEYVNGGETGRDLVPLPH
jgi:hypothetical protein